MPDAIFDHPRVARIYDPLDPDRSDLDAYVNLVDEFGATTVLDVGCGTGTFCCGLADRGIRALGVDPAGASVAVAQTKAGAERVTWVVGTVLDLAADPSHRQQYDLATMTANVAQVFLEDDEWLATLRGIRTCLRPGGRIAFESRVPSDQACSAPPLAVSSGVHSDRGAGSPLRTRSRLAGHRQHLNGHEHVTVTLRETGQAFRSVSPTSAASLPLLDRRN